MNGTHQQTKNFRNFEAQSGYERRCSILRIDPTIGIDWSCVQLVCCHYCCYYYCCHCCCFAITNNSALNIPVHFSWSSCVKLLYGTNQQVDLLSLRVRTYSPSLAMFLCGVIAPMYTHFSSRDKLLMLHALFKICIVPF